MIPPKRRRLPLGGVALAAVAGILGAEIFTLPIPWCLLALALGAAINFFRPNEWLTYALAVATFFTLHLVQQVDAPGKKLDRAFGDHPRVIEATGEVVSEPKFSGSSYLTFRLRLDSIVIDGAKQILPATIRVRWKGEPQLGDEIRLTGVLEKIPPARNPGVFDERGHLAREDIHDELFVRYAEDGAVIENARGNFFLRTAAQTRARVRAILSRGLEDSPDVVALITGIALGERHETENDIEQPFQQTGTLHLFAVAGLHVGILARLLWFVGQVVRIPRRAAAGILIPFLFFYSAVTGLHVSSLRAATMAALLLGGTFFGRPVLSRNSLAGAAVVILAVDPNQLFLAGFQLSFAVVGAIIFFQNSILRPLLRLNRTDPFLPRSLVKRPRQIFERIHFWIARGISISGAAWLGSFVLIIWYFYLITPISLCANLLVVPVAFGILAVCLMSLGAAGFSSSLAVIFNNANWSLSRLVLGIVQLFAGLPGGHVYVARPHWPNNARAEITVLDAGAGAAVHLRAGGQDWMFDAGSARNYEEFVRDYLHSRGVNRLAGLLLSHGDTSHIGGAEALLEAFHPWRVLNNGAADRSRLHHQLIVRLKAPETVARGAVIDFAPEVRGEILFPPPHFHANIADDETLVLRLEIEHRFHVLLVSDSGLKTEAMLLARPNELRSDVLIKGQHISGESGSEEFLAAVKPAVIVATSVDFPARERVSDTWAKMVAARGIKLFRQDETGAVTLDFFEQDWIARSFLDQVTLRSSSR